VTQRRLWLIAAGVTVIAVILGAVVRNQVKVYKRRQARAALQLIQREAERRQAEFAQRQQAELAQQRQALFAMLQPIAVINCHLKRFGETHDGGYLMCGNLLGRVRSAYSYGISGYDKWGCDISKTLNVTVHQYDCFNTTRPACPDGRTVFHAECVGDTTMTVDGRLFDTMRNQRAKNGDRNKRIVLKIDVEGAEWDSLLSTPDEVLEHIDQMAVEFHWVQDEARRWVHNDKYLRVVQRLKQFFAIAHIHFNNGSCITGLEPFPTWAYEVLFVSKRLAAVDRSRTAGGLHRLDAPNNPSFADCQPEAR
jgi:hypothetical protein